MMEKTCPKHGSYTDIYWSSAEQFRRFSRYLHDGIGVENPNVPGGNCPHSCGLCPNHKTGTILANIDVTNRCNQRCPVCFANAAASGYVYEPSFEQIEAMLRLLRSERPVPCPAVQFAGGEPTVRGDIVEIVRLARSFRFTQIQMATNGVRLARSIGFCRELEQAGLNTVYLQFDGVTPEPYLATRGYNALPLKQRAIENCRRVGLSSVTLVPTLAKGVNEDQVGGIISFAALNSDTVKGVNFQPISFAGRVDVEERMDMRITIPDLLELIEEQTDGEVAEEDFYPVPFVVPVSHFTSRLKGRAMVEMTVHPHCGAATYAYVEGQRLIPITRFIDVEGLLECIEEVSGESAKGSFGRLIEVGELFAMLPRYVDAEKAPSDVDVKKLFINILREGTGEALKEFHRHLLFIGAMHFMDLYNLDLERVRRCGIHYATPDGRIIPFCTYNTIHRAEVERRFALAAAGEIKVAHLAA